jgi:hypothetical protein
VALRLRAGALVDVIAAGSDGWTTQKQVAVRGG